jgi:hypothetical protein
MKLAPTKPQTPDHYSLWLLTIAPAIWAAHLLLCYITAAIWCARFAPPDGALGSVRTAIAVYTATALAGIVATGWEGFRRHSFSSTGLGAGGTETTTHDLDSVDDRHRFIGFATLLLAGLSALGVLYAALAASFFESCR